MTTSLAVCSSGLQEEKETIRISRNDTKTAAKLCHGNVDMPNELPNGSKHGDIIDMTDIAFGGRNNCCSVDLIASRSRSILYSKEWSMTDDQQLDQLPAANTRIRLMEMPQEKLLFPGDIQVSFQV